MVGSHERRKGLLQSRGSLALRSAYARLRHWEHRLAAAEAAGDTALVCEAAKFIAEYDQFITGLESKDKRDNR